MQTHRLVVIGAGHASCQLLKHLGDIGRNGLVSLTCISDVQMIPGVISKQYKLHEAMIDVEKLVSHANGKMVLGYAESIDWDTNQVIYTEISHDVVKDKSEIVETKTGMIPFDSLVINVGSASKCIDSIKGVKEWTIPTRPLHNLISQLNTFESDLIKTKIDIVVVGGGCAGVELALCVRSRFRGMVRTVTLVEKSSDFTDTLGEYLGKAMEKTLKERGIKCIFNAQIDHVEKNILVFKKNIITFDLCLWACGAEPSKFIENSGLKLSNGWIEVNSHLQSTSKPNLFAAGDCIEFNDGRILAKSGVYAVREGPILIKNVMSCIAKSNFREDYIPQSTTLKILNVGDGTACLDYNGWVFDGVLVWYLKNYIDTAWIDSFGTAKVSEKSVEVKTVIKKENTNEKTNLTEESPLLIQKN